MNVAVVGFGTEGQASCAYFLGLGAEVTVCDQSTDITVPEGVAAQTGDSYLNDLDRFDVIVRTAGMHPRIILDANPGVAGKLTTQINEFLKACPTRNVIGVTGTKGKGTTSTLIHHMLQAAGKQVFLGGNIGIPVLGFLPELTPESWVVLELSSFQLIDIQRSPHIGVCLMVVPEHLNWHADMQEYVTAKSQLFAHQTTDDVAVYFPGSDNSMSIAKASPGTKVPYYEAPGAYVNEQNELIIENQVICRTDEIRLPGKHNWQNVCAAVTAVWQTGVREVEAMRSVLTSFSGLEYHLEIVRELDGVRYVNDSFGTTPETAIVALEAYKEPKVIILGGSDKGVEFDELAEAIKRTNVRQVILMGNNSNPDHPTASNRLAETLARHGIANVASMITAGGPAMAEVVSTARGFAQPGDVVLLSTACASFDMFPNYKDRGGQFTAGVRSLA